MALVLGVAAFVASPPALAAPARLQLTVQKTTLGVGEKTRISVEFLDRANRVVPNDRERIVELTDRGTGAARASGDLSPAQVGVKAMLSCPDVTFTARTPGRLVIRATSGGLAPGQDLIAIVKETGSVLAAFVSGPAVLVLRVTKVVIELSKVT